ncbi:SH2 domain-containing protein 7 [Megalops cyprinoides]|uniref:SH2 domain-containing protein 7 n=1 Tax=Megalops cyprinoides TaxID=118141 RepID=UPI0018647143|nr:SH2 domain-containing protein 7 [Megalops cyprinoides]
MRVAGGLCRSKSLQIAEPCTAHSLILFGQDRVRMESHVEDTESRLRELALRWFTETQAPLILHDGNFPSWFQGFITRKDAEAQLWDKPLGCFLIRLSEKAIGYILSYRGRDRCRHFVINQNKTGQFIVSGDTEIHDNLTDLIEYYRSSPIEPFDEYLTSSCSESSSSEIYDVVQIQLQEKPRVSVEAVRSLWNQRTEQAPEQPPALPPKSVYRKLTSPASFDAPSPPQAVPLVPKRDTPLTNSMSVSTLDGASDRHSQVLYAKLQKNRANQKTRPPLIKESVSADNDGGPHPKGPKPSSPEVPGVVYSELSLENCRSKSLPLLDNCAEDNHSYRLSSPPKLSPNTSKKATSQTYSLLDQQVNLRPPASSNSLDALCNNPLYHMATRPCDTYDDQVPCGIAPRKTEPTRAPTPMQDDRTYAEVPQDPLPCHFLDDNTYELIPDQGFKTTPLDNNTYEQIPDKGFKKPPRVFAADEDKTYETLKDMHRRHTESSWGIKVGPAKIFPKHSKCHPVYQSSFSA